MYDFAQKWIGNAALYGLAIFCILLIVLFNIQVRGSRRWQWRCGAALFLCLATISALGAWQRNVEGRSGTPGWTLAAILVGLVIWFLYLANKSAAADLRELAKPDSSCTQHARVLNLIGIVSFVLIGPGRCSSSSLSPPWDQVCYFGGIVLFGIVPAVLWVYSFSPKCTACGEGKMRLRWLNSDYVRNASYRCTACGHVEQTRIQLSTTEVK